MKYIIESVELALSRSDDELLAEWKAMSLCEGILREVLDAEKEISREQLIEWKCAWDAWEAVRVHRLSITPCVGLAWTARQGIFHPSGSVIPDGQNPIEAVEAAVKKIKK